MSKRLNQKREAELQPKRIAYAKSKIEEVGFSVKIESNTEISFRLNGSIIRMWPYSGWFQGRGVKAGRGLNELLKQLIN